MENRVVAKSSTDQRVLTTLLAPAHKKPVERVRISSVISGKPKPVSQQERNTSESLGKPQPGVISCPKVILPSPNFNWELRGLSRQDSAWWQEWITWTCSASCRYLLRVA